MNKKQKQILGHKLTHDAKDIKNHKRDYSVYGQIRHDLNQNPNKGTWTNRILIAVPCTGIYSRVPPGQAAIASFHC